MTGRALKDLGWADHRTALWWLGLLYRRPKHFEELLEQLPESAIIQVGAILIVHALPYTILVAAVGRLLLFGASVLWFFGLFFSHLFKYFTPDVTGHFKLSDPAQVPGPSLDQLYLQIQQAELLVHAQQLVQGVAEGSLLGMASGIIFGVAVGRGTTMGVAGGIAFGIAGGIAGGIALGVPGGGALGTTLGMTLGIAGGSAAGRVVGIITGGTLAIILGVAGGNVIGITLGITLLRAYYYPWHLMLRFFAPAAAGYRWHPAAWDDMCSLPFVGLDRFLLALWDTAPDAGEREIERLTSSYPSQRMEALKARAAVIAREASANANLARIDGIVSRLPEGKISFLAETRRVREMVTGIAEAQRRLDTIDRPFLRQPYAEALVSKIEAFRGQISGFREPLATEFRKAAGTWLKRAQDQLEQIATITQREPAPQVFRAGNPVDRSREAFVPRLGVIGQFERQITLSTGCPGLLIYGRRRMGKSTLIRNLDGFVPETVRIASLSMQDPKSFSSTAYFVRQIGEKLGVALNGESAALETEDLGGLFELLTSRNEKLDKAGHRLVLAIDEFENIDGKIGEGVFSADLLATICELIQSHRRLIWVFAGSHPIGVLRNAEWPSYFVSVQTIEVPPFTESETRLLLTDPMKLSPLYAGDAGRRPRFDPGFWGEGGIEWLQAQTAGWPHLVQLLAGVAVDLANESERRCLNRQALEEAAKRAMVLGDTVFRQLVHGESQSEHEKAYIAAFRTADSQPPPDDEATLRSLRYRQIITEDQGTWRLKVPLMQRWLRTRG